VAERLEYCYGGGGGGGSGGAANAIMRSEKMRRANVF
jgi:hypothetical protein